MLQNKNQLAVIRMSETTDANKSQSQTGIQRTNIGRGFPSPQSLSKVFAHSPGLCGIEAQQLQ